MNTAQAKALLHGTLQGRRSTTIFILPQVDIVVLVRSQIRVRVHVFLSHDSHRETMRDHVRNSTNQFPFLLEVLKWQVRLQQAKTLRRAAPQNAASSRLVFSVG